MRPVVELPVPPSGKPTDMVRPGTLTRRRTMSQIEAPELDYFNSKSIDAFDATMSLDNKSENNVPFPKSEPICHQKIVEEVEDTDSDSDLEWGIQENMKLFEISSKDDHGKLNRSF